MRRIVNTTTPNQQDSERGASAIIVAILMVALLGFAAIAIDVGRIYWERAQLQNGADAAAISVAMDCSKGKCAVGEATAPGFANDNANDAHTKIESITYPSSGTVRVKTSALSAAGNAGLSMTFARIFGISDVSVPATAEASWGPPETASSFPWTAPLCAFKNLLSQDQLDDLEEFGHFDGAPSNQRITLRADKNAPAIPECADQPGYVNGGFAWLDFDANCQAKIDLSTGDPVGGNDPGENLPTPCKEKLDSLMAHPILFPIFDSSSLSGNKGLYNIYGYGAFQVTGYHFPAHKNIDLTAVPSCSEGSARCLQGYFTLYSELGDGGEISTGPSLGGTVVRLTK